MKRFLASAIFFSSLAACQLSASTVNVTFNSANGQTDASGYLISPYQATVASSGTIIYCVDFANEVSYGQQWTANITNLASGDFANTRYGAISQTLSTSSTTSATYNAADLYAMAAWLTTQFAPSGTSGYSANGDIQDTIWDLFNPNVANPGVKPPTPSTNAWLYAAEQNYKTINPANFNILTNSSPLTYSGPDQVQEFMYATPEPGSVLLLGIGLLAISFGGRRALKQAATRANR